MACNGKIGGGPEPAAGREGPLQFRRNRRETGGEIKAVGRRAGPLQIRPVCVCMEAPGGMEGEVWHAAVGEGVREGGGGHNGGRHGQEAG